MPFWTLNIVFILLLILVNGIFAMSEIAVVSARKTKLQQWAEAGNAKARSALDLADSPNLFLSTVQVGITLVGVLSGAFGAATIAAELRSVFLSFPVLAPYSETIALAIVVFSITYLSLVLGELVPKRIALNNPERIASAVAGPMRLLSRVSSPAVALLSASTEVLLRIAGLRPSEEPPVTEEELRLLLDQATQAGIIEQSEQDMMESVFRLGDRRVEVLMTPRRKIVWLDLDDPPETLKHKIIQSGFSRFPVCRGRLGNILGIVHVKDLLARVLSHRPFDLTTTMRQPIFVFEGMQVLKLMEMFKEGGMEFALVVDEYGTIEGLVTLDDLLESIVGVIPSEGEVGEERIFQREDGSWLVDGALPVDEFKEYFEIRSLPEEEEGHYQTLGGFVMTYLKRIPSVGDHFECCGLDFEVMDMDGRRVDRVLVKHVPEEPSRDES